MEKYYLLLGIYEEGFRGIEYTPKFYVETLEELRHAWDIQYGNQSFGYKKLTVRGISKDINEVISQGYKKF